DCDLIFYIYKKATILEIDPSEGGSYDAEAKVWHGPKFYEFYDRKASVGRILFEQMRRCPNSICQVSDTEQMSITYEEALVNAIRVAESFREQKFTQRDIVGITGRNTTHLMAVVLACFFNGIPVHAINANQDEKAINALFDITKPKMIFFDGQDYTKIKNATSQLKTSLCTLSNHLSNVPSVLDLMQPNGAEHKFRPAELIDGPDQTLAVLCSSGTTGLPKAVNISNHKRFFDVLHFLTAEDVILVNSTLDWITGLIMLIASIGVGAKRVITERSFDVEYFMHLIPKYKISFTILAPPLLAVLVNSPLIDANKLESLRYFAYGGSSCATRTQQLMQTYLRRARMLFVYGLTEFEGVLTINYTLAGKPKSVGRLQPGFKAKITNESGERLGPHIAGEICCAHERRWLGYYNNNAATETIYKADGWFFTGDVGFFDEDGYLHVVDRKKHQLKYLGHQYCAFEIEEVIAEIPSVAEVCVFGIEREQEGDVAAAVVSSKQGSSLTAADVVSYVKEHIDCNYKQLNGGVLIVHELPKLENSKLNVVAIKKLFLSKQDK
ncbi:luciferin 4-monooxygenase, partial [Ceratitis capitata]